MDALTKEHVAGHGWAAHPAIHHSTTPPLQFISGNLLPPFLKEQVNRT
jgi:hypothetical protein